MSLTLFTPNLLEVATVAATPTPLHPERLYDRDAAFRCEGAAAWGAQYGLAVVAPLWMVEAAMTIDIDLGSAQAVTDWAVLGHTLDGTVELLSGAASPAATSRDSFTAVSGTDSLRTIASVSARYWRVTTPAGGGIAELLLGVARVISENPALGSSRAHTLANVERWYSPAKVPWAATLGPKRARLAYRWNNMSSADLGTLEDAYDDVDQGTKPLLVKDHDGTLRWMIWVSASIAPSPVSGSLYAVEAVFEEVPALEEAAA